MDNNELKCLHALHVAFSNEIATVHRLVEQYGTAAQAWSHAHHPYLDADLEWEKLETLFLSDGLQLVPHDDGAYPALLGEMKRAPLLLYIRGAAGLLSARQSIAVVGTRKPTSYGKQVVADVVPQLVRAGVATVSGLAIGLDSCVHRETVAAGGRTVAVLGSGVMPRDVYPRRNENLAEEIVASGGAVVSEYPPASEVFPSHFPERNRVIAGLARATMVVEAGERSGALITAKYALDANRDVFAVPGSVYSPQSAGTNALIAEGATPWCSCSSFFDALEYGLDFTLSPQSYVVTVSPTEDTLLRAAEEPLTVDELVDRSGLPSHEVIRLATQLVMKNALLCADGQRYQRTPHCTIHIKSSP